MATLYSISEGEVTVAGDTEHLSENFPTGVYTIKKRQGVYFLEPVSAPTKPVKIYGDHQTKVDRIINTWKDRNKDTGILLSGLKGSGKTLIIKLISEELAKEGVSTIYVNENFNDEEFLTFVNAIEGRHIFVFDEYEKTFGYSDSILTLLDGLYSGNRLYLFSANSRNISSFLINRPGRIYYHYKFEGMSDDEITSYCEDRLNDKSKISDILRSSRIIRSFNFDMLAAIVEESNRYNETVADIIGVLNIEVETDDECYYECLEFKNTKGYKLDEIWFNERTFNIFRSFDIKIEHFDSTNTIDDTIWLEFSKNDMTVDDNGHFTFSDDENTFVIRKRRNDGYKYF